MPKVPHHDRLVSIETLARDARVLPGIRRDCALADRDAVLDQLREDKEAARHHKLVLDHPPRSRLTAATWRLIDGAESSRSTRTARGRSGSTPAGPASAAATWPQSSACRSGRPRSTFTSTRPSRLARRSTVSRCSGAGSWSRSSWTSSSGGTGSPWSVPRRSEAPGIPLDAASLDGWAPDFPAAVVEGEDRPQRRRLGRSRHRGDPAVLPDAGGA
jgi:hypothetical protein